MASWLQKMYLQLRFSSEAARLLIREQGLDSLERLRVITDKNDDNICNVMMKPFSKNSDGMPDRGQQDSHPRKPEASCLPIPSLVEMYP